jgi:redox-sensitive bicupin YhaK (pirin superfamily)
MNEDMVLPARTVARVTDSRRLGPDAQVDDKALVIAPDDPALTDPFLVLAEDWFSKPGFNWHPHRGLETVTLVVDGVLEHGDNLGNAGALVTVEPASAIDYPLPAGHRAFVHVLSGRATVAGSEVSAGQTAWSDPSSGVPGGWSTLRVSTPDGDEVARLMVFSGTPLREPVVFGGPFVMNRPDEIAQAFADFRGGKFGGIPRTARLALR